MTTRPNWIQDINDVATGIDRAARIPYRVVFSHGTLEAVLVRGGEAEIVTKHPPRPASSTRHPIPPTSGTAPASNRTDLSSQDALCEPPTSVRSTPDTRQNPYSQYPVQIALLPECSGIVTAWCWRGRPDSPAGVLTRSPRPTLNQKDGPLFDRTTAGWPVRDH